MLPFQMGRIKFDCGAAYECFTPVVNAADQPLPATYRPRHFTSKPRPIRLCWVAISGTLRLNYSARAQSVTATDSAHGVTGTTERAADCTAKSSTQTSAERTTRTAKPAHGTTCAAKSASCSTDRTTSPEATERCTADSASKCLRSECASNRCSTGRCS